jgi:hypothetical protein
VVGAAHHRWRSAATRRRDAVRDRFSRADPDESSPDQPSSARNPRRCLQCVAVQRHRVKDQIKSIEPHQRLNRLPTPTAPQRSGHAAAPRDSAHSAILQRGPRRPHRHGAATSSSCEPRRPDRTGRDPTCHRPFTIDPPLTPCRLRALGVASLRRLPHAPQPRSAPVPVGGKRWLRQWRCVVRGSRARCGPGWLGRRGRR